MNLHSKERNSKSLSEKKKFSFRDHGISSYHAVPAALMVSAGLALSAIIGGVQPAFNQAFASSIEEQFEMNVTLLNEFTTQLSGKVHDDAHTEDEESVIVTELPEVNHLPVLADDIRDYKKQNEREHTRDFSVYISTISEEEAAEKLAEIQKSDRERELWEAKGEVVASYNKNLYLDTYSYQRGPSNIPSTGEYTSCIPGKPISQMVPPASLTFDENGVPENYLYTIEGKSTAYYGGYMTATGSPTRPGVVAVDPREIPYGTEMWIVSSDGRYVYGFCRAEDTGGFIYWERGATVDLYMNSYADCCVWGWRGVKIYVLPTSYK